MVILYRFRFLLLEMNTSITAYLHQKLTEVGTAGFEKLATDSGVKVSFIRKFFYGDRKDPRVNTVQPLLDYFHAQDARQLAQPSTPEKEMEHG